MTLNRLSLMFWASFLTLLIWELASVSCLVNEKVTVQPLTIIENATAMTPSDHTNASASSLPCGNNTSDCPVYCDTCYELFNGTTVTCLAAWFQVCVHTFEKEMFSLNTTDWCVWHKVSSFYSNMSNCTEKISECMLIPWPNPLAEEIFVGIHSKFFHDCPTEELSDPPPAIIFALVVTPICLIPVMVSLVVLKTKNGDGRS